jgi:glycyl-tRNA synthetase
MNPATVLRVLGPEPWKVAYVEPSIRPDDARYGENPNRMQLFYQYQVVLKPDPGDPQEVYLRSLVDLGVDPERHDLRFVEDNWESPALGAWGLGWEVWLDGQEITQYTYFQQAGGITLDPPSVEITYGLERILMTLQGVDHFSKVRWNGEHTYGDLNLLAEKEFSRYYFELADVERLWVLFGEYEAEALRCLADGLIIPAHDYVLKCSHAFNILDSRGAIGVTERAGMFARMRDLARQVSEAYLDQRRELGFPWSIDRDDRSPMGKEAGAIDAGPGEAAPLLVEIGTEELPAGDLTAAVEQLRGRVPGMLAELRLKSKGIQVMGTPRRLVVFVESLSFHQRETVEEIKGPPADRAYDEDGNPTRAALGFAESKGIPVEELKVRRIGEGEYVVAEVRAPGLSAAEVLSEALPDLITELTFEKAMRWNWTEVAFSRPIRWLLAMHGGRRIPFEYAGLQTGIRSRSLRFHRPESMEFESASDYFQALAGQGVILDIEERRERIWEQITALAQEVGGEIPEDMELLCEVANLVEKPTALRGSFDEEYLDLPSQVLIAVMKKHQRCFPVAAGDGLLPYFVAVRNGGHEHLDEVRRGNEAVIRARFADAAYFIQQDLARPLSEYVPRLSKLTFQADLGSMLDKMERLQRLVPRLAPALRLSPQDLQLALAAARLCRADLVTHMVVEMTSLQGEMGRYYARQSGEPPEVAQAIFESYLPRHGGDHLPRSKPGLAVAVADRLDTLVGLFAVGLQPSGAKDPFALRRTSIGLVQILVEAGQRFDLRDGLKEAASGLPIEAPDDVLEGCLEFIVARQRALLLAEGHRYDAVDAVLTEQGNDPTGADQAVKQLEAWIERPDWDRILQAYARCARITRDVGELPPPDPDRFIEGETRRLHLALLEAQHAPRSLGSVYDLLSAFEPMIPAITSFFDEVLVMDDDPLLRQNRLALLRQVVALADDVVDLSQLEGF